MLNPSVVPTASWAASLPAKPLAVTVTRVALTVLLKVKLYVQSTRPGECDAFGWLELNDGDGLRRAGHHEVPRDPCILCERRAR